MNIAIFGDEPMNSKLFITTLMLLSLIAQTVAVSAIPCSMTQSEMSMDQHDSSPMTDHSMHQAQAETNLDSECHSDCNCPMASCLSVFITSDVITTYSTVNIEQSFDVNTSLAIVSPSKSLYRPPITR